MYKKIFVISDLHLGGDEGFQMCSQKENLADFIDWVTKQKKSDNYTDFILVLAGDIIDFLAEKEWESFTYSEERALKKLETVFTNFKCVWDALRNYVETGGGLTILLGNHDIEMSLPKVRRRLLDELGAGKIEFIYDNEAFVMGGVLIEHGNRYDSWNAVDHNALRQVRSLLSRNQELGDTKLETPGSVLVTTVMNDLKSKYKFIDLFKPETLAVALLLSTLDPKSVFSVEGAKSILFEGLLKSVSLVKPAIYGQVMNRSVKEGGMPVRDGLVRGKMSTRDSEKERFENLLEEVGFDEKAVAALKRSGVVSGGTSWGGYTVGMARSFCQKLGIAFASEESSNQAVSKDLVRIFKAFKYLSKSTENDEEGVYSEAANFLAKDFKVIVFGHTHKALSRKLNEDKADYPVYLNSGTWADVISLPGELLKKDSPCDEFQQFVDDLKKNDVDKWRTSKGTFVEIVLNENNDVQKADVYCFKGANDPMASI